MRANVILAALLFSTMLFLAPYAHADKLAPFPNGQSLQPLPAQAHADVSESVDRVATPQDEQNIEASQQANAQTAPQQPPAPSSFSASEFLLVLGAAALVAAALWQLVRSFA